MHLPRFSIALAIAACLLLAGCGKDAAKGASGEGGEEGLPKPDAVSGSVTGMPNPGPSTPQPGQRIAAPPADIIETADAIVPVEGEMPVDPADIPQGGTPELPEPGFTETPPQDPAPPAGDGDTGNPGAIPQ